MFGSPIGPTATAAETDSDLNGLVQDEVATSFPKVATARQTTRCNIEPRNGPPRPVMFAGGPFATPRQGQGDDLETRL